MEFKDEDAAKIFLFLAFRFPLSLQAHERGGYQASLLEKARADENDCAKVVQLSHRKERTEGCCPVCPLDWCHLTWYPLDL